MNNFEFDVVSENGIEATIICEKDKLDYCSIVHLKGWQDSQKIYGVDPLQSLTLGWTLIEELTRKRRLAGRWSGVGAEAVWRVESRR